MKKENRNLLKSLKPLYKIHKHHPFLLLIQILMVTLVNMTLTATRFNMIPMVTLYNMILTVTPFILINKVIKSKEMNMIKMAI